MMGGSTVLCEWLSLLGSVERCGRNPRVKEQGLMLTLTRKVGESIRIGDNIEIVVKEIRRNQVRIGIIAPRDVPIYREEVYETLTGEDDDASAVEE